MTTTAPAPSAHVTYGTRLVVDGAVCTPNGRHLRGATVTVITDQGESVDNPGDRDVTVQGTLTQGPRAGTTTRTCILLSETTPLPVTDPVVVALCAGPAVAHPYPNPRVVHYCGRLTEHHGRAWLVGTCACTACESGDPRTARLVLVTNAGELLTHVSGTSYLD